MNLHQVIVMFSLHLYLLHLVMKQNVNTVALFGKNEGARITNTLFKIKFQIIALYPVPLLKTTFYLKCLSTYQAPASTWSCKKIQQRFYIKEKESI